MYEFNIITYTYISMYSVYKGSSIMSSESSYQGEFDSACGLYAIINGSTSIIIKKQNALELYKAIIEKLDPSFYKCLLIGGTDFKQLITMTKTMISCFSVEVLDPFNFDLTLSYSFVCLFIHIFIDVSVFRKYE